MYMEAGRDRNLTNETKNRLDTNIWPAAKDPSLKQSFIGKRLKCSTRTQLFLLTFQL